MTNEAARQIQAEINKEYGAGAIVMASDLWVPKRFTTGSLSLDISLGGGWSGNQWAEVYGPENHGKTVITLKTIAANQAIDPNFFVFWVASEPYDADQAEALGVDNKRVQLLTTRDMPVAYDVILKYLENRAADLVVLDSYPALIPPDEDEKDMGTFAQTAEGAKMTNKFFRKVGKAGLRDPLDPTDRPWLGLFINQPREKIGGWAPNGMVPETTPGGRGKNFSFYTRLDVKRTEFIEEGPKSAKVKVGQVIRTRATKNKGGPPMRVATMDFYFANSSVSPHKRGDYDLDKDVLTMAVLFDVVHKAGGWYRYEDQKWQGLPSVLEDVRSSPDLRAAIDKRTREVADRPGDKQTWDEGAIESASTATTTIRRKRRGK